MQWWIVYYTKGVIPGSRGGDVGTANAAYVILQAANGNDAETKATQMGFAPVSSKGPYATKAAAQKEATQHPETNVQAGGGANVHLPNPLSGIDAIGNFFNKLGEKELWIRVAEVLLGLLMVGVALGKLSGIDAKITKAANAAIKVA